MYPSSRAMHSIWAFIFILLLVPGCASDKKKAETPKRLSQKGTDAARLLSIFLFPTSWSADTRESMQRSIIPLEYHGSENFGKTLIQAKIELPDSDLHKLLNDTKAENETFVEAERTIHTSKSRSRKSSEGSGGIRALAWWKPEKERHIKHYYWTIQPDQKPVAHTWLQVTERDNGKRLVYVRIEEE